jgi:prepilin-type N-terminal cleavage/methylation domain-containing protein
MRRDNSQGFTLVELMVAMAVTLILLGALYSLFILSGRSYASQENIAALQQNARASLELIARQLTNLYWISSLDSTPDNSSITFHYAEDAGTASGGSSNGLADGSKGWAANQWKNARVIILDGTGAKSDEGTSTGSNESAILHDTNKSWPANGWQGYAVILLGGAGYGQIRDIASNTATRLTVTPNWTTVPDNTSDYQIRQIKTISSNTSTRLTVSPDWAENPDETSLYCILRMRGFSRDPGHNEIDYRIGSGIQPFSENITSLTLQGRDDSGAATWDPADMTTLETALTGRTEWPDPINHRYRYYRVKTVVKMNR